LRVEVDHEESDLAVVFVRGELDRTTVSVLVSRLRTVVDAGSADGDRCVRRGERDSVRPAVTPRD
jgi:hypothetical protein